MENTKKVRFIDNGLAIKRWRMKGMKEHMPEFAEAMMEAAEKLTKKLGGASKVNADVYMDSSDNTWCIDMFIVGDESLKGTLRLSNESTDECPVAIELKATCKGFGLNFGDAPTYDNYTDCLSMLYTAILVVAESE